MVNSTVYLIDDRPGEETYATAYTAEQLAAIKRVCPHFRECTRDEFIEMERIVARLDAGYSREEWL